jgi:hypothetical protein
MYGRRYFRSLAIATLTAKCPKRFKIKIGCEDIRFNHTVAVDVMYIVGKAVLHVECQQIHYQAAAFLSPVTAD